MALAHVIMVPEIIARIDMGKRDSEKYSKPRTRQHFGAVDNVFIHVFKPGFRRPVKKRGCDKNFCNNNCYCAAWYQ